MADSLRRIRDCPAAVWMVKLADRIANLGPPPRSWSPAKRLAYRDEARVIADALGSSSPFLDARLRARIEAYAGVGPPGSSSNHVCSASAGLAGLPLHRLLLRHSPSLGRSHSPRARPTASAPGEFNLRSRAAAQRPHSSTYWLALRPCTAPILTQREHMALSTAEGGDSKRRRVRVLPSPAGLATTAATAAVVAAAALSRYAW